jgi:hypothetical protein
MNGDYSNGEMIETMLASADEAAAEILENLVADKGLEPSPESICFLIYTAAMMAARAMTLTKSGDGDMNLIETHSRMIAKAVRARRGGPTSGLN